MEQLVAALTAIVDALAIAVQAIIDAMIAAL